jgi:hypothetical protein
MVLDIVMYTGTTWSLSLWLHLILIILGVSSVLFVCNTQLYFLVLHCYFANLINLGALALYAVAQLSLYMPTVWVAKFHFLGM